MRRYSYRYAEGREVIFGGHFEFEIRGGDYALVVLADHLIPLAVSEIPTRIYQRFLSSLKPCDITFVEFDPALRRFHLVDLLWTETAAAYRYCGAAALSPTLAHALGLHGPWWSDVMMSWPGAIAAAVSDSRAAV